MSTTPSGWPESTPEERAHAIRMLRKAASAKTRQLLSRKRVDIACRPAIAESRDRITAQIERLKGLDQ